MAVIVTAQPLIDGSAEGEVLLLHAPISFWGGVDSASGTISRPDHPDHGRCLSGRILAVPRTIGSSSSSAVMLELMHNGKAPAGVLMTAPDAILAVGVVVAEEMGYGSIPVFICRLDGLTDGQHVRMRSRGIVEAG